MKFLVLLFLVGCATASIHDALQDEAEQLYEDFMLGLEHSGVMKEVLGHDILQQAEDDIKTEMGKKLRETLDKILEKIKESIDQGKGVSEDMQNKLKEIREKMKELRIDLGEKARELLEKVRERVKNFWREILEKIKGENDEKRSVNYDPEFADWNIKEMFKKLRDSLLQKIDKEKLKTRIEELFGKSSDMADSLLEIINNKGDKYKQKLLDLVDRYLGKKEEEKRSMKEMWEKVRDYFKDLHIDLKEKYVKFGEWVKNTLREHIEKGKDKIANIREIAKEFVNHTKGVSKEVAVEALEFLKPYKQDLGDLWEQVKVTVKDIIKKQE